MTAAKPHIFISYARKDEPSLALKLQAALTKADFDAWVDTAEIEGGSSWSLAIEQAIDARGDTRAAFARCIRL